MHRVLIAITPELPVENEADKIAALIRGGFYRVHLRHPEAEADVLKQILLPLSEKCLSHVVLHSHFELADELKLGGVHLNRRHPIPPEGYHGPLSCSCHSPEEANNTDRSMSYVTLSPIFDSISKDGYRSRFADHSALARSLATVPVPVIALGGITPDKLGELSHIPFSGYAMLGAVPWSCSPEEIELFAGKTVKLLHLK